MRIQHNISALNAHGKYTGNTNALSKNLTKLSSGYRINSAADDAAGLAISEKMRSQIKGLEKAQDNANDGISLIQTAEGALTEVNSMLTRLTELATQSANGTYDTEVDRLNIQEETEALLKEIDRISEATNFNGIKLLDGSLSGKSQVDNLTLDTSTAVAGKYTAGAALAGVNADMTTLKTDDIGKSFDYTVTWQTAEGVEKTSTVTFTFQGQGDGTIDATTKADNFFTDAQGNKLYLGDDGKVTAANLATAISAGLKADESFNAAFEITNAATLVFTAREDGDAGAIVVSTGSTPHKLSVDPAIAGGGTATITEKPVNALQNFDVSKIKTAASNDTMEVIESKIFEIDGHKFLAVASDFKDDQRKTLDDDITVIKAAGASIAAADVGVLSAEITRVTGLETDVVEAAEIAAGGKYGANAGLAENDIVFTEDTLKLGGTDLELQVGDTNDSYQKVNVKIQDMSSEGLGLEGLDLSTQESAGNAIKTIKDAVNKVSTQRGQLGALQNRLDHTVNNLVATTENITASESRIRDVDMAKEMTQYSKNNILLQASQSMLAQANQMPQGVLQLLQ